jgi:F-type H+-transporting ATPase subunit delta
MAETKTESSKSTDTGQQQVGAIYAKALLGSAEAVGNAAELVEELESFVKDVLDKLPDLDAVLSSPRVSHDEKVGLLDRVFAKRMSPSLQTFLKVVSAHGRLDCLRAIAQAARAELNRTAGIVVVEVTTAEPIDAGLEKQIKKSLSRSLGQDVQIRSRTDSAIIGGMVVRIGDKVFDGSVANQLETLREQAISKMAQEIRAGKDRFALSA